MVINFQTYSALLIMRGAVFLSAKVRPFPKSTIFFKITAIPFEVKRKNKTIFCNKLEGILVKYR